MRKEIWKDRFITSYSFFLHTVVKDNNFSKLIKNKDQPNATQKQIIIIIISYYKETTQATSCQLTATLNNLSHTKLYISLSKASSFIENLGGHDTITKQTGVS